MQRTPMQNKKFSAMVGDAARARFIGPWKPAIVREAWKRYFLAIYCREARIEAYANGWSDPFPELTARSRDLDTHQMNELIECSLAVCASKLDLILE